MAIHFAFLDGALGYDCVACGARCCHGLGFALPAAELPRLLEVAPGLGALVQLRARGAFALTSADGCFALAQDSRCGIELAAGRAAKPLVCRLFPLRPRRIGGTLVVDLQLHACPLQPAEQLVARPGVATVTHAQALAELEQLQTEPLFDELTPPRGAPDDLWEREAAAREQVAAALAASGEVCTALGAGQKERALLERWRKALTVPAAAPEWGRTFLLCCPGLRLDALLMAGAPPYPRHIRRLPALLLAGLLLIELAASLPWPVGRGPRPTPRTVAELWRLQLRHRDLLLCWEDRVHLQETVLPGTPEPVARAYAELARRAATLPLGEAFAAAADDQALSPSERALLLRTASDRFAEPGLS